MLVLPLSGLISIDPEQETLRCTRRAPGFVAGPLPGDDIGGSGCTILSASETTPPIPGIGCGSMAHLRSGNFTPQMYLPDSTQCTPTCPALALPGLPTHTTRNLAFCSPCWMPMTSPF